MRSPWVVPKINAMDNNQTRQCLSNDVVRRLTKISMKIFESEATKVLNHMNRKLIHSGYSLKERLVGRNHKLLQLAGKKENFRVCLPFIAGNTAGERG